MVHFKNTNFIYFNIRYNINISLKWTILCCYNKIRPSSASVPTEWKFRYSLSSNLSVYTIICDANSLYFIYYFLIWCFFLDYLELILKISIGNLKFSSFLVRQPLYDMLKFPENLASHFLEFMQANCKTNL